MSMTFVIVVGVVIAWVSAATFVALVVARMIRLRDRQRPRRAIPVARARVARRSWKLRQQPPPEA